MVKYLLATREQQEMADVARKIPEKQLAPQIEALEKADEVNCSLSGKQ